ncbi:hypothetical protein B0H12DRAFT_1104379 [Mycena haematopus]|nr:hypothetical protein B0H12DRAFT_1104379 [Mycena haematopus]
MRWVLRVVVEWQLSPPPCPSPFQSPNPQSLPPFPSSRELSVALVRQLSSRATPAQFEMDMLKPEEMESAREGVPPATRWQSTL